MGLGLRAVVEAEDGLDGTDEFGGQGDAAFADAVGGAVVDLVDEGDAEGFLHGGDGADEFDGAAFRAGGVGRDGEAVLFGEGADELDGFGIGAVALAILGVGETFFAGAVGGFERALRRTMTETVILVPDGAGVSPAAWTKGAFSLPGRTVRGEAERVRQSDFFFVAMRVSPNLGMNL